MSEAQLPNSDSDLFEPAPIQDALAPAETPRAEVALPEWVTVNFPDAIGVDDVPHTPEPSQAGLRIQDLERQNQKLVARITELTVALSTAQTARKTEADRHATILQAQSEDAQKRGDRDAQLMQQQASLIVKQRQALDAAKQRLSDQELQLSDRAQELRVAHDRVMQLSHDLDRAAQTEHKQQILIETLTAQLEASQTQVAQLERDCALTKQRYDEQIQLVRQTETACRDLRSRLHRQQQYTLQFKAALEKCLDVPAAQSVTITEPVKADHNAETASTLAIVPRKALSAHCFVKAQPVQPWSAPPGLLPPVTPEPLLEPFEDAVFTEAVSSENPFSDLSSLEELWSDSTEPILESPQPLIADEASIIALETDINESSEAVTTTESRSESSTPLSYTIARSTPSAATPSHPLRLFTPSESEALPADNDSIELDVEPASSSLVPLELRSVTPSEDVALQRDLIQQNEPAALGVEFLVSQPAVSEDQPDSSIVAINDSEPLTILNREAQLPAKASAIQSSPFITLSEAGHQPIRGEEPPSVEASESSPSPIVYPDRTQKRISSLAAVDLPSFPKTSK